MVTCYGLKHSAACNYLRYFTLLVLISFNSKAQLLYNKGQLFHSDPGLQLRVEGSFENDSNAFSDNNGILVIDSSFYNLHNSKQKGNGEYDVSLNWVNSAHFAMDTSFVHLKGLTEYIEGDSITSFYNLSVEGVGRKILMVNANVYNNLHLNSSELAINEDTLFIQNPKASAIDASTVLGSEGFISTLDIGRLVRKTNSVETYYLPFGSIIGPRRFRPIALTPNDISDNEFALSFQNKKPDVNGYYVSNKDTTVCAVNPFFYHTINRLNGTSPVDLYIAYLNSTDGFWNEIGNWEKTGLKWINTNNGVTSNINSYSAVKRSGWNNFTDNPYSLEKNNPIIDSLAGENLLCGLSASNYKAYMNNAGSYVYSWTSADATFLGDTTAEGVTVKFTSEGKKQLFLKVSDPTSGCSSTTVSKSITVSQGPKAGFSVSYVNLFLNTPITFTDSSQRANSWLWDFGNGYTSKNPNPQTSYSNGGNYLIKQVVTDTLGCKDSTERKLLIDCYLKIPNVFTPNGDGINDVFSIESTCIQNYTIQILDRWGLLVYKGTQENLSWDGRTSSGQLCPEGTYYFTLQTNNGNEDQKMNGFITLLK